jgi:hypothetical protein
VDIVASLFADETKPSHVEESNAFWTRHRPVGMMPYPNLVDPWTSVLRDPRVRTRPGFARTLSRRTSRLTDESARYFSARRR